MYVLYGVSRSWIAGDAKGQPALLPVAAAALLPADHRVFDILALVGELDLRAFEAFYRADGRGRPPFHPRVMLALILYCRSKGLMSGRAVAGACYDDLGARLITGNRYPDRSTIDTFVRVHAAAIKGLLPQTLRLGYAEDLVDVSLVAGDGTKVLANAAMGATLTATDLLAQITDLQQQLAAAQKAWLQQIATNTDAAQPSLFTDTDTDAGAGAGLCGRPGGDNSAAGWRKVCALTGMLRSRQSALAYLQAHPDTAVKDWTDRLERDQQRVLACTQRLAQTRAAVTAQYQRRQAAEANGVKFSGTKPVPVEEHSYVRRDRKALETATARAAATATQRPTTSKVNTTDPASQIMPGKHDGFDQRHNIQSLTTKNQFILAIGAHRSSNDKQALATLVYHGRANLDAANILDRIGTALFDNGYASEDNFTADLPVDLLLVAVEKEARQTRRLPQDTATTKPAWQIMTQRFEDPENRKLYKQRAAIIEPLFAQLFARFGRGLNLRGEQVDTELHLWAVTHNLLKISRHRHRHRGRNHRPG